MKRITSIAFFALAGLLTVGNLAAQDAGVQANIPFDFKVGNSAMPAGTYRITALSDHVITIRNKQKLDVAALSLVSPTDSTTTGIGELVFNKYGDQYFLRRILSPSAMNVNLPTSKLEKRESQLQREANLERNSPVLLALK